MPLQGSQNSAAAFNGNTTPGACDITGMWGIALPSPTGPVVGGTAANPLVTTSVPAVGTFDYNNGAVSETSLVQGVRAATVAKDPQALLGFQNVPVHASPGVSPTADDTENMRSLYVNQARGPDFAAVARERLFAATDPFNTTVASAATLIGTSALTTIRQTAANTDVTYIRSLSLVLTNTPTDLQKVVITLDMADLVTVAGTALTPANQNETSANTVGAGFTILTGSTLSGAGARRILHAVVNNVPGTTIQFDFGSGICLGVGEATLAVHVGGSGGGVLGAFFVNWLIERVV